MMISSIYLARIELDVHPALFDHLALPAMSPPDADTQPLDGDHLVAEGTLRRDSLHVFQGGVAGNTRGLEG